jgi:endonuclease/exonuclease/phosphatase (EEP) superfamily protein YafD
VSTPLVSWIFGAWTTFLLLVALLPLSRKKSWWVRDADFPRLQAALLGVILVVCQLVWLDRESTLNRVMITVAGASVVYQLWWIWPYTRLHRKEVKNAATSPANRLRILSSNVLMTNRRAEDLIRLVRAEDPDILITLETDRWWEQSLKPLEANFPHRLACPLDNLYGMHLYSRLPLEDAKIQFLVQEGVPSMHMLVVLPSGRRLRLHCLHPAPPSPTENESSKERDAELVMVGRAVVDASYPVIVSGDLNDVAWSHTTRLFRRVSGLLDPRIGRGMYNTFHAGYPVFRWPVDHFFHSPEFTLVRLARLTSIGSDHFPVFIELALNDQAAPEQPPPEPEADDHEEAKETMARENVSSTEVHRPGERRRPAER